MFARMNNGQAVSRTDIAIAKNDSSTQFDELGKHELFTAMLGTKGIQAKKYRGVIVKTYEALMKEKPNYKSSHLHNLESSLTLSDDDAKKLQAYMIVCSIYISISFLWRKTLVRKCLTMLSCIITFLVSICLTETLQKQLSG